MENGAKKKIVVDARMVGPHGHGIGNYVQDIAAALGGREKPYELTFLIAPDCPADSVLRSYQTVESKIPFLSTKEIFFLNGEIARLKPDLFHSPSFSSFWRYAYPVAFTVHDLNHLHFAGTFHRLYYRHLLLPALRGARAIASVSETAAAELDAWMRSHQLKSRISVVPNAIHPPAGRPAAEALARYGLTEKNYFFCLSNPKPHKNLEFLKEAYLAARAQNPTLPPLALSTLGKPENGIVHLGSLPADLIAPLLASARAFFFPSLYEGFGRPPAEAVLLGTLPIAADIPVLRETLAGVKEARFLSPLDQNAWTQEFLRLEGAPAERLSEESIAWVRGRYSLARVAETADQFYREALSPRPSR